MRWDVKNADMGAAHFKAFAAADFFFDGSDRGTGIYTEGPPRFIGGTNADTGNSGGFAEVPGTTPWSRYQALEYGSGPNEVWGKIEGAAATREPDLRQHRGRRAGRQRRRGRVGPVRHGRRARQQRDRDLLDRRPQRRAVDAADQPAERRLAARAYRSTSASAFDTNGVPYAGGRCATRSPGQRGLRHSATLGADGTAVITDPGTNAGADTVVAFLDFNNDGARQAAEPQASALATFVDSVPPACP